MWNTASYEHKTSFQSSAQTLRSLPLYPSVMAASSLKSISSSTFSFESSVLKISSLLSRVGSPTMILFSKQTSASASDQRWTCVASEKKVRYGNGPALESPDDGFIKVERPIRRGENEDFFACF